MWPTISLSSISANVSLHKTKISNRIKPIIAVKTSAKSSYFIYIITQAVKKEKGKFKRQVGGQRRHRFRLHPPPLSTLAAVKTSPSCPHTATGLTLCSFHLYLCVCICICVLVFVCLYLCICICRCPPSYPHTATGLTLTSFHPFNALVSSARSSLAPQHHRNFVRFHSFQRDSAPQCHNTRFLSFHLSCFFSFSSVDLAPFKISSISFPLLNQFVRF